jgi:transposase
VILREALEVRDRRDAGLITASAAAGKARELQRRIVKLTEPIKTNAANERFAAHLFRQQHHLFTFLRREAIDATNWRAEQALRPAVVNRKVWGGNRTERGAEAQSILMTVCQTARKRGLEPMHWISNALLAPHTTPPLLPAR